MESEFNPIKPINGMLKFFLFCGLWPAKSKYKWIYWIYAAMFHFLFTFAYIYFKIENLFIETDIRLLTVGFFIFLAEVSLVVRIVNLLINFDDITECLSIVKKMRMCNDNEIDIMKGNFSFFSKVMTLYVNCGTSACLCSWIAPLFSSEPMLPYPASYPVDWKHNSQSYWLAFSYQVIGVSFQAYGIILLQLFSIYLMAAIGAHLDVLKYRLENLGQRTTEPQFVECIKLHQEILR